MCLIALAWQPNDALLLVLAANRDELHARASTPLGRWPGQPGLLAGRDEIAGGSWLGVSEHGRLAAVTNVREPTPPPPGLRSRGELVAGFLRSGDSAHQYASALEPQLSNYAGCNLLLLDLAGLHYLSNRTRGASTPLAPGLYSLSNAGLDSPWPKSLALRERMAKALADEPGLVSPSALFAALADESRAPDAALPDTGVGLERERLLAPAFIRNPTYGTRCSTVVQILRDGRGEIIEHRFGPNGRPQGESRLAFRWPVSG